MSAKLKGCLCVYFVTPCRVTLLGFESHEVSQKNDNGSPGDWVKTQNV